MRQQLQSPIAQRTGCRNGERQITQDDERKKDGQASGTLGCSVRTRYILMFFLFPPPPPPFRQFSLLRNLLHRARQIKKETETKLCWWKDEKTRHDVKYITEEERKQCWDQLHSPRATAVLVTPQRIPVSSQGLYCVHGPLSTHPGLRSGFIYLWFI
jgi:hypothetical protein